MIDPVNCGWSSIDWPRCGSAQLRVGPAGLSPDQPSTGPGTNTQARLSHTLEMKMVDQNALPISTVYIGETNQADLSAGRRLGKDELLKLLVRSLQILRQVSTSTCPQPN